MNPPRVVLVAVMLQGHPSGEGMFPLGETTPIVLEAVMLQGHPSRDDVSDCAGSF